MLSSNTLNLKPTIRFGKDGWIAEFGEGFTDEALRSLAEALGLLLSEDSPGATVYVGYDTRRDAARHAAVFAGCLKAAGLTPFLSDAPCPTPVIAWSVAQDEQAIAGVMITASAHKENYQGVLLRMHDGACPPASFIRRVEDLIPVEPGVVPLSVPELDLITPYTQHLLQLVDTQAIRDAHLRFVVDPLYGAGAGCLAHVLRQAGCEVRELHLPSDGSMGGLRPDPVEPWIEECKQEVQAIGADAGFALDGDADRSAVIDNTGAKLSPRCVIALIMQHLVKHHQLDGSFIATISSSTVLVRNMAERLQRNLRIVPIGFRNVCDEMAEDAVVCGFEEHGDIGVPHHLNERDGIFVSLLFAEMLALKKKPLSVLLHELETEFGHMEYIRHDIRIDAGTMQSLRNILPGLNPPEVGGIAPCEVNHIDGLYLLFEDGAWLLVRPSRIDSVVRIYAEAPTLERRGALIAAGCALCRAGGVDVGQDTSSQNASKN